MKGSRAQKECTVHSNLQEELKAARQVGIAQWGALSGEESVTIPLREVVAMPQYVIEREIPGAGNLTDAELQAVARKSVGVLKELGPEIKWLHSYVTGDKVYCVYLAPDEETIREHARRGGFPANRISAVRRMIDPDTAN
jgi:hypothetical protein